MTRDATREPDAAAPPPRPASTTLADAAARLRHVLDQRALPPGGTFGMSDSALLVALADLLCAYVRRELERDARTARERGRT